MPPAPADVGTLMLHTVSNHHQFEYSRSLNGFITVVVCATAILIYAGGMVTTIGAGLAVPDWPLSFGSINPAGWWKTPMVREEHGHRLIGAVVGILTMSVAIWLSISHYQRWLKRLGVTAFVLVVVQGVIGGLRVVEKNIGFAILHACLAQIFFCVLITLAWGTSRMWGRQCRSTREITVIHRRLATVVCLTVFIQLIIGAIMRHTGAGMAIPTFPLVFGHLLPAEWSFPIAIHYAHRLWAIVVFIAVSAMTIIAILRMREPIRSLGILSTALVVIQITLGAAAVVTGRGVLPTTLHVLVGACLLATTYSCVLWTYKGCTSLSASPDTI